MWWVKAEKNTWKNQVGDADVSGWWSGIILADCLPLLFCGVMMMTMMLRMLISPGDDSRGADVRLVGWVGWCLSRRQALRLPAGSAILKTSELLSPCSKFFFFFLSPPPSLPSSPWPKRKMSNCQTAPSNSLPKPSFWCRWQLRLEVQQLPVQTVESAG